MNRRTLLLAAIVLWPLSPLVAGETPAPEGAKVTILNLKTGDVVKNPVTVKMGIENMAIAPAGTEMEHSGHHHLLIDTTLEGDALNAAIPADDNHVHFGKGQTETTLELSPGQHTLQLMLGDHNHVPHNPPVSSEPVTITVE